MKMFCTECLSDQDIDIKFRPETITVRGEPIEVQSKAAICRNCGSEVLDSSMADEVLKSAYDAYRKKHGLLSSDEIRQIRKSYGLSHRALASLLGWGLVTTQRYERGLIQDEAHDAILREMRDNPLFVFAQFEKRKNEMTTSEQARLGSLLFSVYDRCPSLALIRTFEQQELLAYKRDPKKRGCRTFTFDRASDVISQLVCQLVSLVSEAYLTKMAKLLWVSDFASYLKFGRSLTGLAYARLPYGPAPNRFSVLLGLMEDSRIIALDRREREGYAGEVIRLLDPARPTPDLDKDEIELLRKVVAVYGGLSSKRLSEMSHREPIWKTRADGDLLPYSEASSVSMVTRLEC